MMTYHILYLNDSVLLGDKLGFATEEAAVDAADELLFSYFQKCGLGEDEAYAEAEHATDSGDWRIVTNG